MNPSSGTDRDHRFARIPAALSRRGGRVEDGSESGEEETEQLHGQCARELVSGGLAARHVIAGKILYRQEHWDQLGFTAQSDADRTGVIVWVKPAVTADDAADVRQYKLENPDFPHQTTVDQWYDEAQFESYRKLAYDSVTNALRPCVQPGPLGAAHVQAFFSSLEAQYP